MAEVSIRELRNHGGDVVDRATRGEEITITRSGKPVAELRAAGQRALSTEELIARFQQLPRLDYSRLREDLDSILDPGL
jgi:antitoxin (DNA-binding transcriptional repressor) of toxin-antitoxin stability system